MKLYLWTYGGIELSARIEVFVFEQEFEDLLNARVVFDLDECELTEWSVGQLRLFF